MKKTKIKTIITILLLSLLIAFNGLTTIKAEAKTKTKTNTQKIKIRVNGNGQSVITKDFNGVKLTVKTPKITKNKYLKLINIGMGI